MARRRSLNRRWSRRSMNGTEILNQDSNIFDEGDQSVWWKHVARDSESFKGPIRPSLVENTPPVLDPNSRIESTRTSGEWWNVLEKTTDNKTPPGEIVRVTTPKKDDIEPSSSDSDVKMRNIKKKRVLLRKNRQSSGKDVFSQALDSSENDIESAAANKRKISQQISIEDEHSLKRSRLHKSLNSSASTDSEKIQKVRPKLLSQQGRKSKNNFDSILQDDDSVIGPSQNTPEKQDENVFSPPNNQISRQSSRSEKTDSPSRSKSTEDRQSLNKSSEKVQSFNESRTSKQDQSLNTSNYSNGNYSSNKSENTDQSYAMNNSENNERDEALNESEIGEKTNSPPEYTHQSMNKRLTGSRKKLSSNKSDVILKNESANKSRSSDELQSLNKSKSSDKSQSSNVSKRRKTLRQSLTKSTSSEKTDSPQEPEDESLNEHSTGSRRSSSFNKSDQNLKNESLNKSRSSEKRQSLNTSKTSVKSASTKRSKSREKKKSPIRKSTNKKTKSSNNWEVSEISNFPDKTNRDDENQSINEFLSELKTQEINASQSQLSHSETNNDTQDIIETVANETGESTQQIEDSLQSYDVISQQEREEISQESDASTDIDEEPVNQQQDSSERIEKSTQQVQNPSHRTEEDLTVEEQDENLALHLSPQNHDSTRQNVKNQSVESGKNQINEDSKYPASDYSSATSISEELIIRRSPSLASSNNAHSSFKETSIHKDARRTTKDPTDSVSMHPSAYDLPPMNRSGSSVDLSAGEPEEDEPMEPTSARETVSPKPTKTTEASRQTFTPIPSTSGTQIPRQRESRVKPSGKSVNIATNQQSLRDFLIPRAPPRPREPTEVPAVDPDSDLCKKLLELKQQRECEKEIVLAAVRNARAKEVGSSTRSIRKKPVAKKNPTDTARHVDKAFLVNGKVYRPPRLPRPKHWATDRLYKYLWKKMEPKYGLETRVRSEKFVIYLAKVVALITRRKKFENYRVEMDDLMKKMAHLRIIVTPNDFYNFCYDFLPYDFRAKVTPILLPGNQHTIPFNPDKIDQPILN